MGTCLVTGEENVPIARVHPATTGVPMARGTGISLVSFGTNYDVCAYNWYDKQQGYIAPVSLLVTEQYGNALKYLLTTKCHYKIIGNSYLVFWAAHDEDNSLATVLSQMELGREIPEELYQAIVEIYVYFLNFDPKDPEKFRRERNKQTGPAAGGEKT
jgi:hypothetical protein